ncbi:PREDICTED: uncharacterized protein LOC106146568 [Chinchilla lanigera]|uniref:uncharacterized protein LOC106146568 n=1 Tax=Chinchilla lanigera TaxID=34839 RepID=UPI0006979FA4|nr:PREDICTED: uncharacterized protein LOC106146568 [Chinchilla lanigera]
MLRVEELSGVVKQGQSLTLRIADQEESGRGLASLACLRARLFAGLLAASPVESSCPACADAVGKTSGPCFSTREEAQAWPEALGFVCLLLHQSLLGGRKGKDRAQQNCQPRGIVLSERSDTESWPAARAQCIRPHCAPCPSEGVGSSHLHRGLWPYETGRTRPPLAKICPPARQRLLDCLLLRQPRAGPRPGSGARSPGDAAPAMRPIGRGALVRGPGRSCPASSRFPAEVRGPRGWVLGRLH